MNIHSHYDRLCALRHRCLTAVVDVDEELRYWTDPKERAEERHKRIEARMCKILEDEIQLELGEAA